MDQLLADLGRDPLAKWRSGLLVAGALGLGGALILSMGQDPEKAPICTGAEEHMAEVWEPARSSAIETAFENTGQVYGKAAFDSLVKVLDAWTAEWASMHTEACEAHHLRGEQSADMMDRRMACLDRQKGELAALVDVFMDADAEVVRNAVSAAEALPRVEACGDLTALDRADTIPTDDITQRSVTEIRAVIDRATALRRAGKYPDAKVLAEDAANQARELGVPAVTADAVFLLARLLDSTGEPAQAEDAMYEALAAAETGENDSTRATISAELVWLIGHRLGRPDEAKGLLRTAQAVIARAGREDLEPGVLQHMAVVLSDQGKHEEAVEHMERTVGLMAERLDANSLRLAGARNRLGAILFAAGNYEDALPHYQTAYEVRVAALGPDHPLVSHSLGNIALVHFTQGKVEEARKQYEAAQAILERVYDEENLEIARGLLNLGGVVARAGDYEKALEYQSRAEKIFVAKLGSDHPLSASAAFTHGQALAGLGRTDEALPKYRAALASWEKSLGDQHPQLGHALTAIALIQLGRGATDDARAALERAHEIRAKGGEQDPSLLAETDFALARALWSDRTERKRAIELARSAAAGFRAKGEASAKELAAVETWLADKS